MFYSVSIISIAVLSVLNTTIVYRYVIDKYELEKYTLLTEDVLMDNYKRVISYVQNPFRDELVLNNIPMSEFGKIHFFEVKRIFIALYFFGITFIIMMIWKIIMNKRKDLWEKLLESFNRCVNIIAIVFISISIMMTINFSKAFYFFHKIFFRNDYWIFDPKKDPIINALPEELFMIEAVLIVILLLIFTVGIKFLYLKNKKIE